MATFKAGVTRFKSAPSNCPTVTEIVPPTTIKKEGMSIYGPRPTPPRPMAKNTKDHPAINPMTVVLSMLFT